MGYFANLNSGKGVPFMDDRDKGEKADIIGKELHFDEFDFIKTENGRCAVATFKELPETFYFMNEVVTNMLDQVRKDGQEDKIQYATVVFSMKENQKGNREYFNYEFISEDEIPF